MGGQRGAGHRSKSGSNEPEICKEPFSTNFQFKTAPYAHEFRSLQSCATRPAETNVAWASDRGAMTSIGR
jgi:hypothetical protein